MIGFTMPRLGARSWLGSIPIGTVLCPHALATLSNSQEEIDAIAGFREACLNSGGEVRHTSHFDDNGDLHIDLVACVQPRKSTECDTLYMPRFVCYECGSGSAFPGEVLSVGTRAESSVSWPSRPPPRRRQPDTSRRAGDRRADSRTGRRCPATRTRRPETPRCGTSPRRRGIPPPRENHPESSTHRVFPRGRD